MTMDLAHSKTMESEVYNIPDSKSTDMIQPTRPGQVPNDVVAGAPKGKYEEQSESRKGYKLLNGVVFILWQRNHFD